MTPAPVANQIDQEVLLELLAVGPGHSCDGDTGFRIISIHMDDGHLKATCKVGSVERRARVAIISGETNLIIEDDMDRSADMVALEL